MGLLIHKLAGFKDIMDLYSKLENKDSSMFGFLLQEYSTLCLFMIAIGILFLFNGIFLLKFKLWANRIISALSGIMILLLWTLLIFISDINQIQSLDLEFILFPILTAISATIPFAILIWFLNKRKTLRHFKTKGNTMDNF